MTALRSGISRTTLALPVLLFALLAVVAPNFLAPQNLTNVVGQITALLIVSLGQLLVALVAGIDLSVGSVMSLAGCLVATQPEPLWGIVLALLLGLVVGITNGLGVAGGGHPSAHHDPGHGHVPAGPGLSGVADPWRRRGAGAAWARHGQPVGRAPAAAVVRAVRRGGVRPAAAQPPGPAPVCGGRTGPQRPAQRRCACCG